MRHDNLLDTTAFSRGDVEEAFASLRAYHRADLLPRSRSSRRFWSRKRAWRCPQGDGVKVFSQSQGSDLRPEADRRHSEAAAGKSGRSSWPPAAARLARRKNSPFRAQTALAAFLLQRPVKTVLTRKQSTQHHRQAPSDDPEIQSRRRCRGPSAGRARAHRRRYGRLRRHRRQMPAARGVPFLRRRIACPTWMSKSKAVFTNNPTSGAMRGFGSNQAQFAMEGIMDMLAEKVGVDGYDIRERNVLNPGDAFATGQIMRESVAGMRVDARSGEGHLQEREICRHRLRHQEHRHRQRHGRKRTRRHSRARRPAARDSHRLHGNGPGRFHHDSPGGLRRDRDFRRTS